MRQRRRARFEMQDTTGDTRHATRNVQDVACHMRPDISYHAYSLGHATCHIVLQLAHIALQLAHIALQLAHIALQLAHIALQHATRDGPPATTAAGKVRRARRRGRARDTPACVARHATDTVACKNARLRRPADSRQQTTSGVQRTKRNAQPAARSDG
jgi:hypothetical protein